MTTRGFAVWLVLFLSGSSLWLLARGAMWFVGYALILIAIVWSNSARCWRPELVGRGRPAASAALVFLNVLPMFVAGWDINRPSQSAMLRVVYLLVAGAVVASNAFRTFSRVESHAA